MRKKNNYNEDQLLDGFRKGQEKSFSEIFRAFYPTLCFYAFRITKDQASAEDIVGEAFLKVWNRRAQFIHFNVLKSYLYTTIRNDSINWVKHTQRQQLSEKEMADRNDEYEKHALEGILRAELFREIYKAMDNLPAQCNKVMTLLYVEGKSTKEVARELNMTTGTVKTQKARGLMLLKKRVSVFMIFCEILTIVSLFLYSSSNQLVQQL